MQGILVGTKLTLWGGISWVVRTYTLPLTGCDEDEDEDEDVGEMDKDGGCEMRGIS